MQLIPYDVTKVKTVGGYKKSENLLLLEEFANSELQCAKVENFPHKDAWICAAALRNTIKRNGMTNIECITRNGEVFLIKTV